jgi:hypothetical protein
MMNVTQGDAVVGGGGSSWLMELHAYTEGSDDYNEDNDNTKPE